MLLWIRWGESHSNAPCDGGEAQRALAPQGACLRFEEHSLPCTVPHWRLTSPQSQPGCRLCRSTKGCGQSCVFPVFSHLVHAQCNQFPFRGPVPHHPQANSSFRRKQKELLFARQIQPPGLMNSYVELLPQARKCSHPGWKAQQGLM